MPNSFLHKINDYPEEFYDENELMIFDFLL